MTLPPKPLPIDDIRALLHDRKLEVVAKATGLHRNTLSLIRSGEAGNPNARTLKKLSDYLTAVCKL